MKAFLASILLLFIVGELRAQEIDTLQNQSHYKHALDTALADGKISQEERALLNIMVESLLLSVDSSRVWEQRKVQPFNKPLDQSGRWPLVLQNIAIGSGLYGWGIPYVLHAEDGRWFVGGVMVSAGSSFYLTYKYTQKMEMSHSRAQMMRYGSLVGLRYGFGLNQLLDLDSGGDNDRETLWVWTLMASVPAGLYGGELLFDKYNPSNGQAWAWTMWTGVAGLTTRLIYKAISPEPAQDWDDYNYRETDESKSRRDDWFKKRVVSELIAYPLGAWYGQKLVQDKQYTFGDALMLMQGWGFGYFNTMMLQSLLFDDGDEDTFFMVAGLGAIGSTFAYDHYIWDDDFTFGQSTLMLLGSASGTAFGFGTAILLNIDNNNGMLSLALAGYGTGTWMTRKILDVLPNGSLAYSGSTQMSLMPTLMPTIDSREMVTLIPGLDLRISFK